MSYVLEELGKDDYEIVIYPTRTAMDATRMVQEQGKKYDLIVCSGGDGTLDEVVTGMQKGGFERPWVIFLPEVRMILPTVWVFPEICEEQPSISGRESFIPAMWAG